MTLTISLPADLELRLREEAQRLGVAVETCAFQVLSTSLPSPEKQIQAVALLQSWIDDTADTEQKETGDFLVQALDADRLSDRKLFPPELKGVTW